MKFPRNALLASILVLIWSFVFTSATVPVAFAQQDEASQPQYPPPPPDSTPDTQAVPSPNQGQTYNKPDAGRPMSSQDQVDDSDRPLETPAESANVGPNQPYDRPNDANLSDQDDRNNPPSRVARLQYMTGSVSIQPHGTDDWVQGSVNRPLTIADNVWADKDSRAELNVGTGLIRIGSETSLTLTNVGDNSVQLSLHQGTMNLHVRHLFSGEVYEVDTPNQAFTVLKTGDYRFEVDPNADTTLVTVRHGEGEATGQGPSVKVKENEQARFSNGNTLTHEIHQAPRPDDFDQWCQVRDRRLDSSVSARYVSPDVIGSEDLDAYGTWRNTPDYGSVWVPTQVQPGWAPYTDGNWIYENPWGLTWVDSAPWGFAPFHYGRWISFGGNWGWAPGPYYGGWGRGWYAPALVSWFGGGGWGIGFGFGFGGGFGWCPLGWGEPFFPWYHTGWGYFRGINVFNAHFNNFDRFRGGFHNGFYENRGGFHSANLNARGGFTAVSRGTLERGLSVRGNAVHVNASAIRSAPAIGRPGIGATAQNRLGANAGRPAAAAPRSAISRPTVSRMTPPAASRGASFNSGRTESGGFNSRATTTPRTEGQGNAGGRGSSSAGARNVPRPPENFGRSNNGATNNMTSNRGFNNSASASHNVPRPSSSSGVRTNSEGSYSGARSGSYSGESRSVPRPTGPVQAAPRSYSSGGNSGYSSRSYSQGSERYNSSPYSGGRSYSGSSYGSSYGRSSYGGSSYEGGSRSTGYHSYGGSSYGGGHYSAPSRSYSSGRSSGGSSGGSHGGGGGHSSGGHSGGHR
jgi:hypothetical protein